MKKFWRVSLRAIGETLLICFSLIALYPVYYMITTGVKTSSQYLLNPNGFPTHPSFASFALAFAQGQFGTWLTNSAIVTGVSTFVTLCVSLLFSYALARMRFLARKPMTVGLAMLLGVSPIVILVPLFVLFVKIRLVDSLLGVIVIYVGEMTPFATYLLTGFVREVAQELLDAAAIDGAGPIGILWYVILPVVRAALSTAGIIIALSVWNDLLIPLIFLQSPSHMTVMAGLTLFESRALTNAPEVMAGTFVAAVPMVVMYVVGFRFFRRGLMLGAIR